jgi:sterol desaturase/sphingolipid hydroxylase (fatty acid hydroxylase superfamily)
MTSSSATMASLRRLRELRWRQAWWRRPSISDCGVVVVSSTMVTGVVMVVVVGGAAAGVSKNMQRQGYGCWIAVTMVVVAAGRGSLVGGYFFNSFQKCLVSVNLSVR